MRSDHAKFSRHSKLALTATVALAALLQLPAYDDASAATFRQRMSTVRTREER